MEELSLQPMHEAAMERQQGIDGSIVESSDDEESSSKHQDYAGARPPVCTHSYLGEVDDITCRRVLLDGGTLLTLPMFYLEGTVLFPGATLPLRILKPHFKAAVELAMHHEEAPCTLGVVHIRSRWPHENGLRFAMVGTTAEIRKLRLLDDGSINIVARGCQRFRTVHAWTNADGVMCAQIHIISEDMALHIPRDAFGALASVPNFESGKDPTAISKLDNFHDYRSKNILKEPKDKGCDEVESKKTTTQQHAQDYYMESAGQEESSGSHGRGSQGWWWCHSRTSRQEERHQGRAQARQLHDGGDDPIFCVYSCDERPSVSTKKDGGWEGSRKRWALDESKWLFRAQRSAWPHWVYRMFDAYDLARRAADMWKQIVELPSIYDMVRRPEMMSYHIASKIPVQDATRQELLEIDGVVPRLQKEIQLLESMNHMKCETCMTLIARRNDILVMSPEGPMDAYVNNFGFVHETLTLLRTQGLMLEGGPETQHSWFPGYSWTIAYCSVCRSHMGWLFKAVKKGMHPRQFWGVRRSQLAESTS